MTETIRTALDRRDAAVVELHAARVARTKALAAEDTLAAARKAYVDAEIELADVQHDASELTRRIVRERHARAWEDRRQASNEAARATNNALRAARAARKAMSPSPEAPPPHAASEAAS